MCKLRGIIWYIIHSNWLLLKFWPHFTFGWPFVNISLSIHPTHSKLYTFVILIITSRVIWYTWKVIWSILKSWPPLVFCVTPTGKGPNRPKFCQNIFWPITTSNPSITHFRQNGSRVHVLRQLPSLIAVYCVVLKDTEQSLWFSLQHLQDVFKPILLLWQDENLISAWSHVQMYHSPNYHGTY